MGEEYDCLNCAMVRYNNCIEGLDFYYNKRIIKDDGKYIFVIDNTMPVQVGELLVEEVVK